MNKIIVSGLALAMALFAAMPVAHGATNTLQYEDDFEIYAEYTPLVDGLNDWYASSTAAVVRSVAASTGGLTKAAMIPVDVALSNRYQAADSTNVWMRMDVRAVRYDGTNFPVANSNGSCQFYIDSNGFFTVYDGVDGWRVATNDAAGAAMTPVPVNVWIHLDVRFDYAARTWQLDYNLRTVCSNMRFAASAPTTFTGFEVYSGGNTTSYLDNVSLLDADAMPHLRSVPPGLTNSVAFGLPVPTQHLDIVSRGDGAIDYYMVTNPPASWLQLSSGAGSLTNFATNRVYVSYITNGLTPGRRETSLWLISTNWGGSTQEVPVVFDLGSLRVRPEGLTNTAMQGRNPVGQSFMVTNGGAGVFNYTVATNASWLSVSAATGTVAPGATVMHNVSYNTAGLAPGEYPAVIAVASPDHGGITQTVSVALTVVSQPVLAVQPLSLPQMVEKGGNPTGMFFNVWNAGALPRVNMDYTITDDAWWILPCVNGSSSGETNAVGVNFADMTTLATGVYAGVITIVGRDNGTGYTPIGEIVMTSRVDVAITIRSLPAPAWMSASSGTDAGQVTITWAAVPPFEGGTVSYEVWRGSTRDFDPQFVMRIAGGLETTSYNDTSAQPGVLYYYWVRAVNRFGGPGALSNYDSGYRALGAPEGIWATSGDYFDKVKVRWVGVDGAQVYQVWRRNGGDWAFIQTATGLEYDDADVVEGLQYHYKIRAAKYGTVIQPGDYSREVTGYVLSRPAGLAASQGTVVGRVRLTWNSGWGATQYEVWRLADAVYELIGTTTAQTYDDATVVPGTQYTYKLKSRNASGVTDFSAAATGYAGADGVDLAVWQPVFLPRTLRPTDHARVLSLRIANQAGATLEGDNGTVAVKYFASNHTSGVVTYLGGMTTRMNLAPGASQVLSVQSGAVNMPAQTGTYTVWVEALPAWPSRLSDTNPLNNTASVRAGVNIVAVSSAGSWGFNDYDGDGISDLVMYVNGAWYGRTVDGRTLAWAMPFGGGAPAIYGQDFDGDQRAEPAVFNNGAWLGMLSASGYAAGSMNLGGAGCIPVPGDYTGNGRANLAVYCVADGRWFILDDGFAPLVAGEVFGAEGVTVVPGDYDGDGIWDLTLYHQASGRWYSRGIDGSLKMWGTAWGGPGYVPVMGDYDGDGAYDLAVYREATGTWFIQTARGEEIVRSYWWGGTGYTPVPGDYDGDGLWDLTIYARNSGHWQSRSLWYGTILRNEWWGLSGYLPVGAQH